MSSTFKRQTVLNDSQQPGVAQEPIGAASTYIVMAGLSALFVSIWFPQDGSLITILIATFLGIMFGIRFWTVGLIFLMVQAGLFLAESVSLGGYSYSPGSSLPAIGTLALLISSCRYLALTSSPMPYRMSNRASITVATQQIRRTERDFLSPFGVPPRHDSTVSSLEFLAMLVRVAAPVAIVSMLLRLIPLDPGSPEYARLIPPAVRTITLGVVLLIVCVLINGLMSILAWRRLSVSESRIFLRSELSKWIHREVSAVSRRRIRFRTSRRR